MIEPFVGTITLFAGDYAPEGWALCNGQLLSVAVNRTLFSVIGNTYGGDGHRNFSLPDLRGRVPIHPGKTGETEFFLGEGSGSETAELTGENVPPHSHAIAGHSDVNEGSPGDRFPGAGGAYSNSEDGNVLNPLAVAETGGDAVPIVQPVLGVSFIIATRGPDPSVASDEAVLGTIVMFAGSTEPKGWYFCDGRELSIHDNEALYSILGTLYGGDGSNNFKLPDMQGRIPRHAGAEHYVGIMEGEETVQLTPENLPQHTHKVRVTDIAAGDAPAGNYLGKGDCYSDKTDGTLMNPGAMKTAGSGLPFSIIQPVLGINFIICYQGLYPTRG